MDRPVPLDPEALSLVLAPDLGRARTLPKEAYTSQAVFDWEREHLFERAWVCVARADEIAEPGDQRAIVVGSQGILLVRDEAGTLRGFYNACRHRGHELVAPGTCIRRSSIVCPYHSWSFHLAGDLKLATRFSDREALDPAEWPLVPVETAERFGWVFVAAHQPTASFDDWLRDLDHFVGPWAPEELQVGATRSYTLKTNWKVIIENFSECYHCPAIHPELCRVSWPDSGSLHAHSGFWIGAQLDLRDDAETMSLDGRSGGEPLPGIGEDALRQVHGFSITPNLLLSLHPDFVLTHRLTPLSAGETAVECQWLFHPEVLNRPGFDPSYAVDFWDITNRQDFGACESVYRGMRTHGYRPGLFDERERIVRSFQAQVAESYARGHWVPASHDLMGNLPTVRS